MQVMDVHCLFHIRLIFAVWRTFVRKVTYFFNLDAIFDEKLKN